MKSLYSNLNLMSMVSALNEHFAAYFHEATRPMRSLLCGIVLAMLAFESIPSIRWMHRRFHLSLMPGSLNSYYRATVHAYVTVSESGARRLFICTAEPSEIRFGCASHTDDPNTTVGDTDREFLPLSLYSIRWNIEVGYYEHKTFWSLGRYMLRRRCGIERLLNLICMAHASMRLLPYVDTRFARFKECSPQEVRMAISKQIQDELFLSRLADEASNTINSADILSVLRDMVKHWNNAA